MHPSRFAAVLVLLGLVTTAAPASAQTARPFGTLQEQAALQQEWLQQRLDTFLPALMRKHDIDMWVIPMREYAEDPVFRALAAPETFAARRRTISHRMGSPSTLINAGAPAPTSVATDIKPRACPLAAQANVG